MSDCRTLPRLRYVALCMFLMMTVGCSDSSQQDVPKLRIATTTSTRDSGLLDVLLPEFTKSYPCDLSVIAVGTGAALKLGREGEVDLLIVHAPEAEAEFMADAHGQQHRPFMKNHFVLLGPPQESPPLKQLSIHQAFEYIAKNHLRFVSRGDDSGTHKKELALWQASNTDRQFDEYTETGQGMGNTLMIASELRAFTLCDAGTYLRFQQKIELSPVLSDQDPLENRYSVITVHPGKNSQINQEAAMKLFDFLTSAKTAALIENYQFNGQSLFTPVSP